MSRRPRAVFYGTPSFAVPALEALHEIAEVAQVICQPDKPKGRGMTLAPPPVKQRAQELGLPVAQPTKLRDGALAAQLRKLDLDFALVIAYGRILPADVLSAPRAGSLNLHASILPAYRGAAPITWAVVEGQTETGITLMQMDEGMDTGPILHIERTPIGAEETAGELSERLSLLAASMVKTESFLRATRGELTPIPQPQEGVSLAPILQKSDGKLDWSKSAAQLDAHVRGMQPWPGTFTQLGARTIRVLAVRATGFPAPAAAVPGAVISADKHGIVVATGSGDTLELLTVQPEGKRAMRGVEWVSGRGVATGDQFV